MSLVPAVLGLFVPCVRFHGRSEHRQSIASDHLNELSDRLDAATKTAEVTQAALQQLVGPKSDET